MLRSRIIPCLLLRDESLVKTVSFKKYNYIGDPVNTVKIFNELEVDELLFLDIMASVKNTPVNFKILKSIADECFMPLAYGGGIQSFEDAQKIFAIGIEKIVINSYLFTDLDLIGRLAKHFGSQSIVGSIDVKCDVWGRKRVHSHHGTKRQNVTPVEWAKKLEESGVGEILVTSIDREGTWKGYDLPLMTELIKSVKVPVIANGGAGGVDDIIGVVNSVGVSAAGVGSVVVYQKKGMGVLVNFPEKLKGGLQ